MQLGTVCSGITVNIWHTHVSLKGYNYVCGSGDCTQNAELQLQDDNIWSIVVLTGIPVITNKIYYAETALVKQHPTGKSIFVCVTALEATLCQYAD